MTFEMYSIYNRAAEMEGKGRLGEYGNVFPVQLLEFEGKPCQREL